VGNKFRIYRILSGNISHPAELQLSFVSAFPSIGEARKYLRSSDFFQHIHSHQLQGDYVIISTHQHYQIQPITTLNVRSLPQIQKDSK
jgi:hypothetical protein